MRLVSTRSSTIFCSPPVPPVEADFPVLDSPFSFVLMLDSDLWEPEEELMGTNFVLYIYFFLNPLRFSTDTKMNREGHSLFNIYIYINLTLGSAKIRIS